MKSPQKSIVSLIHLGCPKNLIDSEKILGHLAMDGYLIAEQPEDSEIVLVNTCGFIEMARKESRETINSVLNLKKQGKIHTVVATGCLAQLYGEKLREEFPELDGIIGFCDYDKMGEYLDSILVKKQQIFLEHTKFIPSDELRLRVTPKNFAYLRITEGCDNRCSYCNIPRIRGEMRSKPIPQIIEEAKFLIEDGARELIIIGQDTASYGMDLSPKKDIYDLVLELSQLQGIHWIRLMYFHPAHFQKKFVRLFEIDHVLPYLEMPIQHVSPLILKKMGRGNTSKESIRQLIQELRSTISGFILRTTVMVGFPGESDRDFQELLEFIEEIQFERLGTFIYSCEPGTIAAQIPDQIPLEIKEQRYDRLMQVQQKIAFHWAQKMVNQEREVVLEERMKKGIWRARSYGEAPEIDPCIYVNANDRTKKVQAGTFCNVRIVKNQGYDLIAKIL